MAIFGGLVITNDGRNVYAKAQTGKVLKFKKIVLGDGELGSSESMATLTKLKHEVLTCKIMKMSVMQEKIAKITFILNNQELEEGFYWREIGVVAEDPDTGKEILYCYGNAREHGEYISSGNSADILEKRVNIDIIVENASNISAVIDESLIFITQQEFEEQLELAQQDLVDDISKTYRGANITANTVAGYRKNK